MIDPPRRTHAPMPTGCAYPTDKRGAYGFLNCGAATMNGRPYCETHCTVCYTNFQANRNTDPANSGTRQELHT